MDLIPDLSAVSLPPVHETSDNDTEKVSVFQVSQTGDSSGSHAIQPVAITRRVPGFMD